MVDLKQIKVDGEVKAFLDSKKVHPRESYNEVLRKLLKLTDFKR